MLTNDFYNIQQFGKVCKNAGFLTDFVEESLNVFEKEKISNLSALKDEITIKKPCIIDNDFTLYNKIKEYLYGLFIKNNYNTDKLFNNSKLDLSELGISGSISTINKEYILENFDKELILNIEKKLGYYHPIRVLQSSLQSNGPYNDIKTKLVYNNINNELNRIETDYYFMYFYDQNTNTIKNLLDSNEIKEIFEAFAKKQSENTPIIDKTSGVGYLQVGDYKIPSELENINDIIDEYTYGKIIIEKYFTTSFFGTNIAVFPTLLNQICKNDIETQKLLLNLIKDLISEYNEKLLDKKIAGNITMFQLLYDVKERYLKLLNSKETVINIIPFQMIIYNKGNGQILKIYPGMTLGHINDVLNVIKDRLNIKETAKIFEVISKLSSNQICYSGYLNSDGYTPKNEFLLKIDFNRYLLEGNIEKAFNMLQPAKKIIIEELRKKYNGTSRSKGYMGNWYMLYLIQKLTEDELSDDDNIDLLDEYFKKNSKLIYILKEAEVNITKLVDTIILKLDNKDNLERYLLNKLPVYTLNINDKDYVKKDVKIKYLKDIFNNTTIDDYLYIIYYFINKNYKKVALENGMLYSKNKHNLFGKIVNINLNNDIQKSIIFISQKLYFNTPGKESLINILIYKYLKGYSIENIDITLLRMFTK